MYFQEFKSNMIKWSKNNLDNFPWREKDKNHYQIFIAEIFLKRTTAYHVTKIYENFITLYPSFKVILRSKPTEIESVIRGLGLQKQRTDNLIEIAYVIVTKHNNKIPLIKDKLMQIKGVGEYVSDSFLCFALNKRTYPIDSNVQRVFGRVFIQNNWKDISKKNILNLFQKTQPFKNFKNFNYSILDFGRKICKPSYPRCKDCIHTSYCISS